MKYSCNACGMYVDAGSGHDCYRPLADNAPRVLASVAEEWRRRAEQAERDLAAAHADLASYADDHLCHPAQTVNSAGGGVCVHCGRTLHAYPAYEDALDAARAEAKAQLGKVDAYVVALNTARAEAARMARDLHELGKMHNLLVKESQDCRAEAVRLREDMEKLGAWISLQRHHITPMEIHAKLPAALEGKP